MNQDTKITRVGVCFSMISCGIPGGFGEHPERIDDARTTQITAMRYKRAFFLALFSQQGIIAPPASESRERHKRSVNNGCRYRNGQ